jgi:hypothetical protein
MKRVTILIVIIIVGILLMRSALSNDPQLVISGNEASEEETRSFSGLITALEQTDDFVAVSIDEVEFLSGEEAIAASMEDSGCPRERISECIPSLNNDFYIRNTDQKTYDYIISSRAAIKIFASPGSPVLRPATTNEFTRLFHEGNERFQRYVFNIVTEGNTIVSLEEQYMP